MNIEGIKSGVGVILLTATLLTGCGSEKSEAKKTGGVVILLGDNTATIAEVSDCYGVYNKPVFYLTLTDGTEMEVASQNMVRIKKVVDEDMVYKLAQNLIGEDGIVYYYGEENSSDKTR